MDCYFEVSPQKGAGLVLHNGFCCTGVNALFPVSRLVARIVAYPDRADRAAPGMRYGRNPLFPKP